jgi:hypothetical protein
VELLVKIIDNSGISIATTYISADSKEEVIDSLREELDSAESGESSWLDGAFDD